MAKFSTAFCLSLLAFSTLAQETIPDLKLILPNFSFPEWGLPRTHERIGAAIGQLQVPFHEPWSSTRVYSRDQQTLFDGGVYVSTINSNVKNIPGSGTAWSRIPILSGSDQWRSFSPSLVDQRDLQKQLDEKANINGAAFTGPLFGISFQTMALISASFWGNGSDNIAGFFGNAANCNGTLKPCAGIVDPSYSNAEHFYTNLHSGHQLSMVPSQAYLQDFRNGQRVDTFHNPAHTIYSDAGVNDAYTQVVVNDVTQNQPTGTGQVSTLVTAFDQFVYNLAPGLSLGNPKVGPNGWTVNAGHAIGMLTASPGISNVLGLSHTKAGTGDTAGIYIYNWNYGGATAASDEGIKSFGANGGEMQFTYTAEVGTGGAGATTVVAKNCTNDCNGLGDGRYLIDTKTALNSGHVTGYTHPGGSTPGIFTIDSTIIPSTFWGTLAANVNTPVATPQGSSYTSMTFTVNSGPGNIGSPNVGDLVCFGGTFHEQARISVVHGTGPWTINASLRHAHEAGSWIMANGPCGEFLDFTANDVSPSGETLHYPLDILGATAANILQYRYFALGSPQSVQLPLGNVNIGQLSVNGLHNRGGIVTMNVSGLQNNLQIIGASRVTISGAKNSVFNGACTNVKAIPSSTSVTCSQSTANSGAISDSANMALGDSAYGNSDYVLWAGAEVLDVLDYATSPPSMDGRLTLEPNKAAWTANDPIELAHHVSYLGDTIQTIDQIENPMQKSYQGWSLTLQGTGINNGQANNPTAFAGISLSNGNSASMYKYHGGMVNPPGGYRLNGIFNFGLAMHYAPDGPGNPVVYVGPPFSGANDPFYSYPLWNLQGNGNSTQLIYWPNTRELSFSGDPIVLHTDLGAQGFRDNITFKAMANPTVSLTTSGRGGTLEHSKSYCYRVMALNSIGNSLPSSEECINTASAENFNSVTITWNRVIGATQYYIYGRSSGTERLLNGVNGGESIQFTDDGSTSPRGAMPTQNTSLGRT